MIIFLFCLCRKVRFHEWVVWQRQGPKVPGSFCAEAKLTTVHCGVDTLLLAE